MQKTIETYSRFKKVWDKYRHLVWFMCLNSSRGDIDLGSDFSQECALALLDNIGSLQADAGTYAEMRWVIRIVRSTVKRCKVAGTALTVPVDDSIEDIADTQSNEAREVLVALMAHLPDDDRLLLSYYIDGFKYRELAMIFGISEDAVAKRFSQIKQKLIEINEKYRYYEV